LILLVAVLGCSKLRSLTAKPDARVTEAKKIAEGSLRKDILSDPPSPSAIVVKQLARLDPEAASFQQTIENLERSGLKEFLGELAEENNLTIPKKTANDGEQTERSSVSVATGPLALAMFQTQTTTSSSIGVSPADINFMVTIVSAFSDWVAPALTERGEINPTKREYNGTSYTDMSVEIGRGADGATKFGFKMNTRGMNGNRSLDSDIEGRMEGKRCPDANGNVDFTVKIRLSGKHGSSSYIQDVTAKVTATTNDDGDANQYVMKLNQGIQESVGGRNTYIENEFDVTSNGGPDVVSPPRTVRSSQDAGPHPEELATSGNRAGLQAGYTGLKLAEAMWKNGGCVAIVANSPGRVDVNSTTQIPVDVKHKYDGSAVPSKISASLAGESSIAPTSLPTTAGEIAYTAPGEQNKTAKIELTSKSKRGGAKITLDASTGGAAYRIVGGKDAWQTNTVVCDIMKPFTLTGGGVTMKLTGGLSGTYTYTGPFGSHGGESYTISLPEGPGKPGTMTGGGVGCAMGKCRNDIEKYTLTPVDSASCSGGN
jgi:hypothetical protein